MTAETRIWWAILFVAGAGLIYKAAFTQSGLGLVYVVEAELPATAKHLPPRYMQVEPEDPAGHVSWPRSVGLWIAAFFTLSALSYLYCDNVCYKLTESIIVGVSAGYLMVVGFWDSIVKDLLVNLAPDVARAWAVPSVPPDQAVNLWFLIPLVLGLMLFLQFVPKVDWLAKWPLAFVVGTFAGLRLVNYMDADFVSQIRNSIVPMIVMADGAMNWTQSLKNTGLVLCLLTCLSYFVFSVRHHGALGVSARIGMWVLMVTFGAAFGFTVMGRITLLTRRLEFLLHDCLRLI